MNKCNSIPNFNSIDEVMDFWDTHEFVDHLDEMQDVEFEVELQQDENYVRIDESIIGKIQEVADKRRIPYGHLINQWLSEKIALL